ncbi:thiamine pyrophosphate-binding protein [Aquabacterium sp. J223]|uniref:thiamine pyrophosphate-binding protein n=1 Tax=Aquabacterium sp. J223 TaxID=2898431 RepID=UPI0021ADB44A|nr:thiamine pyrophosphate-dependent enzyme [Aquabacterium sp. J223]UUX95450.1 thiamine pyrophosphate-dependent enzyme [Aquabacterium sp. J223]
MSTDERAPLRRDEPTGPASAGAGWGSDVLAEMLRRLGLPYLALNPGASYRGLHDSLVNHLGNAAPQMLLCLHEESAVALAHGYAKASDRPMGAVLHSNVGLMHASMSVFNAWCDRVPMLLLGATGPWDAAKRRPWIDWIHTCSDQGALVRDYTKWDNQPASVPAACEALMRAMQLTQTAPRAPTYVNLDAALQEARLDAVPALPDPARHAPPPAVAPAAEALEAALALLRGAQRPVLLAGRCSRSAQGWRERVALAEALNARVLTDQKMAAAFPTDHPLHAGPPGNFLSPESTAALREADVVLALDWTDTAGTLRQAWGDAPVDAKVIHVSPDAHLHRGWSHDYQALPPADVYLLCEPDAVVPLLLPRLPAPTRPPPHRAPYQEPQALGDVVSLRALAVAFNEAAAGQPVCLTRVPLGWHGSYRHFRDPLDYLGLEGGGGVGAGPGLTIGAALALRDSGRLPVAIMGDGDFLMGVTALWTACHYGIPCLMLVANNRSFFNDEMHQERVAKERGRPVENKWIGQRIDEPDIDLAAMARAQGAHGIGPVTDVAQLRQAVAEGLQAVRDGRVVVVDVRVQPGYDANPSGPASQKR